MTKTKTRYIWAAALMSIFMLAAVCLGATALTARADGEAAEPEPPVKYAITATGEPISIGNNLAVPTTPGTKVNMEYTVADKLNANQATATLMTTDSPEACWPNVVGQIKGSASTAAAAWLAVGAHYKVTFTVVDASSVSIAVVKTVGGVSETLDLTETGETGFEVASGTSYPAIKAHYGMFFANGNAYANYRFTDVCFYDGDGKDLGVRHNNAAPGKTGSITVTRMDAIPEYSDIADEKIVIENAQNLFIGNKNAFGGPRLAERVVMEYRVEEATHTYTENGFVATSTPTLATPFEGESASGKIIKSGDSDDEVDLLEAGATYHLVFEYLDTNGNFSVTGTKIRGGVVTDISYTETAQAGTDYKGYVGIWLAGGTCTSATLMEARIFTTGGEHKGWQCNDTTEGVFTVVDMNIEEYDEVTLKPIQVEYTVKINNNDGVYICSDERYDNKTVGSKVYMDWEVVTFGGSAGFGFLFSNTVESTYPYTGGQGTLCQGGVANTGIMMKPGYRYHAQFEIVEGDIKIMVQSTEILSEDSDEEPEVTTLSRYFRTIRTIEGAAEPLIGDHAGIYMWAGTVTGAEFKIKIYDAEGNNLGLTQNAGYAAGPAAPTIEEPEYSVTYMNGETDITAEFNESYATFTCGKGMDRLPIFTDTANKLYSESWYYDVDLGEKCTGIARMTKQENVTLYAKMAKFRYTVEFDAGDGDGSMDDFVLEYDQSAALPACTLTRTGYEFKGWVDEDDNEYDDGETVQGLSTMNGDYITLYAVWEIKNYTVTYVLNGGVNDADNAATFTVNDAITLKDATKAGSKFLGWYTTENFEEGTKVTEVSGASNVTLYARFEAEKVEEEGGCGSDAAGAATAAGAIVLLGAAAMLSLRKVGKKAKQNR